MSIEIPVAVAIVRTRSLFYTGELCAFVRLCAAGGDIAAAAAKSSLASSPYPKMSDLLTGIANFSKSVQNTLNSYEMRKISDKVQGYVMNFTEAEAKVREATNEDPWGPTGPQMQELAHMTFQYDLFPEIMGMLWKRMLQENKVAWRRVYKSLILLNHLLKNGSERVISTARDHLFELRALESYKCYDERGKDEGINVRHRVRAVIELLQDDELLRGERRKSKTESRDKYQGFSKEEMVTKGKVSSFESWNEKKSEKNYSSSGFDDEPQSNAGGNKKEITAFDFGDGRNRSGSPELGIRERTPPITENDDDDEFGDFTEARSSAKSTTNNVPGAMSVNIPALKAAPKAQTASTLRPVVTPQKFSSVSTTGMTGSANPMDMILSFDTATASNGAPAQPQLFSMDTSPVLTSPTNLFQSAPSPPFPSNTNSAGMGRVIKPPSLDDIFGASTQPVSPPQNLFANVTSPSQPGNTPSIDDIFGSSTVTPSTAPPPVNNDPLLDIFSSQPATTNMTGLGQTVSTPNYFSMPLQPASSNGSANGTADKPQLTATTPESGKLSKTWEDLGKVNIDFDNLSLRPSASKPTPSLAELQKQKPSTPSNNYINSSTPNNNALW
ncbi:ENTH domain-containing protein [Ditylenchus destructor]|uniref:ENTH domain-containing protein n=1 Tax=Ditylenchus destructor TaxID=166010 RepID=A0AAD4R7A3_9BILA|nr:ENTH domain-containing protein [Ditylenchus destructor]